jgi:hypothetical protein
MPDFIFTNYGAIAVIAAVEPWGFVYEVPPNGVLAIKYASDEFQTEASLAADGSVTIGIYSPLQEVHLDGDKVL